MVEGEILRLQKKSWFRKKKGRRVDEQLCASLVEGAPPSYESIASELEDEPAARTSIAV